MTDLNRRSATRCNCSTSYTVCVTAPAQTISDIYKDRWQIELFFKSVKQLLKIKTFVGTTENAVRIQIWTALISMLILRYLRLRSSFGWSLSNLTALLRQQLFVHRPLWAWLNEPYQAPESPCIQMELEFVP